MHIPNITVCQKTGFITSMDGQLAFLSHAYAILTHIMACTIYLIGDRDFITQVVLQTLMNRGFSKCPA